MSSIIILNSAQIESEDETSVRKPTRGKNLIVITALTYVGKGRQ